MSDDAVAFAEINGKFDQVMQKLDNVKDKQEEMAEDIGKIKEAVYNPDEGLYARLRELESWKNTSSRLLWLINKSLVGLTVATIFKSFI